MTQTERKRWWHAAMGGVATLPVVLVSGCFSDDDVRAIIGDLVAVSADAVEVAINNLIDETRRNR